MFHSITRRVLEPQSQRVCGGKGQERAKGQGRKASPRHGSPKKGVFLDSVSLLRSRRWSLNSWCVCRRKLVEVEIERVSLQHKHVSFNMHTRLPWANTQQPVILVSRSIGIPSFLHKCCVALARFIVSSGCCRFNSLVFLSFQFHLSSFHISSISPRVLIILPRPFPVGCLLTFLCPA